MIFGIIVGVWFIIVGVYSFYYADSTMKTGNVKAGWIVSKNVQLTNCKNPKGFIDAIYKKTNIFATVDVLGGIGIIVGTALNIYVIELVCLIILLGFYFWYSSAIKAAEKTYLSPSFKKKAGTKL